VKLQAEAIKELKEEDKLHMEVYGKAVKRIKELTERIKAQKKLISNCGALDDEITRLTEKVAMYDFREKIAKESIQAQDEVIAKLKGRLRRLGDDKPFTDSARRILHRDYPDGRWDDDPVIWLECLEEARIEYANESLEND